VAVIVTLRAPAHPDGSWDVALAAVPREGETVTVDGDSWTVRRVVHYPVRPGEDPKPPYVVIWR
jgi:hypothetical protein